MIKRDYNKALIFRIDTQAMAIRESDVIVVTSPYIPGYRIVRVLGVALALR